MKCDKCGYENFDEAYLCRNCGMKMNKAKKRKLQKEKNENMANMVSEAIDNINYSASLNNQSDSGYNNYGGSTQQNNRINDIGNVKLHNSDYVGSASEKGSGFYRDNGSSPTPQYLPNDRYNNGSNYNYNSSAFYQTSDDSTPKQGNAKPIIIAIIIIFVLLLVGVGGMLIYLLNPKTTVVTSVLNADGTYSDVEIEVDKSEAYKYKSNSENIASDFTVTLDKTVYSIKGADGTPLSFNLPKEYKFTSDSIYYGEFERISGSTVYITGGLGYYRGNAKDTANSSAEYLKGLPYTDNSDAVRVENIKLDDGTDMYILCKDTEVNNQKNLTSYKAYINHEGTNYVSITIGSTIYSGENEAYDSLLLIANSIKIG